MKNTFTQEHLSWVDLLLTGTGGLVWFSQPDRFFLPFVLMILPKLFMLALRKFYKIRPHFYLLLFIFLLFAGAAAHNAYNPETAWQIYAWLVGSTLVFLSLAGQPAKHFPILIRIFVWTAALLSFFMLFSNNFYQVNSAIGIIRSLSQKWMQMRPFELGLVQESDFVSGFFALILPLNLALLFHDLHKSHKALSILTALGFSLNAPGLLLLNEYDAWLGLAAGAAFLLFYLTISALQHRYGNLTGGLSIVLFTGLAAVCLFMIPAGQEGQSLFLWLVEKSGFSDRLEMAANTLQLLRSYPYLGAGLGSFSGIYSKYLLLIPYHFTNTSHNLFLNMALETGICGVAFLLLLFISVFAALLKSSAKNTWRQNKNFFFPALIWSWGTLFVHWLTEDPLYATPYLISLFFIPGLSLAFGNTRAQDKKEGETYLRKNKARATVLSSIFLLIFLTVILFNRPLFSAWYANLGVIELAKTELKGWPEQAETDMSAEMQNSKWLKFFNNSLDKNPGNSTARFQLGRIQLSALEFTAAAENLKTAIGSAPNHRGIQKALGLAYSWLGQEDEAVSLLSQIPEAKSEMEVYVWWWKTQERDDLSENAAGVLTRLH